MTATNQQVDDKAKDWDWNLCSSQLMKEARIQKRLESVEPAQGPSIDSREWYPV